MPGGRILSSGRRGRSGGGCRIHLTRTRNYCDIIFIITIIITCTITTRLLCVFEALSDPTDIADGHAV